MPTTADYLNQLQADKQTLVTNLNAKGVEASDNETFTTLVPKVSEIQSGETFLPNYISFYNYKGNYINLDGLNTSNINDMKTMFFECEYLTKLDLKHFDTSNVTSMENMFAFCDRLKELDISNFDTSKVITMRRMFYSCNALLKLDLSKLNLSSVTNFQDTFNVCNKLSSLKMTGVTSSLSLSSCPLDEESVSYILQNLGTVTTSTTLTLGTKNLAKATEEDLASATAKGWTVN